MNCLSWTHPKSKCSLKEPKNPGLLAEGTAGAIFEIVEAPVMSVEGRKVSGIVFTDSGSNMNFITHQLAQQLLLEGANTKIFLKVVDEDYTEKEVKVYRVGVEDNTGKVHWMEAVGVGRSQTRYHYRTKQR